MFSFFGVTVGVYLLYILAHDLKLIGNSYALKLKDFLYYRLKEFCQNFLL